MSLLPPLLYPPLGQGRNINLALGLARGPLRGKQRV